VNSIIFEQTPKRKKEWLFFRLERSREIEDQGE
jgi:hypothetical protein